MKLFSTISIHRAKLNGAFGLLQCKTEGKFWFRLDNGNLQHKMEGIVNRSKQPLEDKYYPVDVAATRTIHVAKHTKTRKNGTMKDEASESR